MLILHSFGPDFGDPVARDLRAELGEGLPGRLELYDDWLVSARFPGPHEDAAFAAYLQSLFADRPLDLVITLGGPAANFILKYQQLLPDTPKVLGALEVRHLAGKSLPANVTTAPIAVSFTEVVESILQLLPRTSTLAVVTGNSALERYWVNEVKDSLQPYSNRLHLEFVNDLPFREVLSHLTKLPSNSAIFYLQLSPDVDGIPQDEDRAFSELHTAAAAPMFGYSDVFLGKGIVGGPMISHQELTRRIVTAALSILGGQAPSQVQTTPVGPEMLAFDWRELRRWGISESRLPAGSKILFHAPGVWQRYRLEIGLVAAVMLLEIALVAALLAERRRRGRAEIEAHHRLGEIAHMNRRATAGELSASIAHELGQPLGAILRNSEAAELLLEAEAPNLGELREIVSDIKRDDQRAAEVIRRLRRLLTTSTAELQELDLNDVAREVFQLVSAQAAARHIGLSIGPAPLPLRVSGDRVQLQQVVLNLVMNGMDAIVAAHSATRQVTGTTRLDGEVAEVCISDSGPGIASDDCERIFAPFFTTKETGMGMGLAIARTIIETHGGRIWADSTPGQGAVVYFTLPLTRAARTAMRPLGAWSPQTAAAAPEGS